MPWGFYRSFNAEADTDYLFGGGMGSGGESYWELQWEGRAVLNDILEASRRAIDFLNAEAYAIAAAHPEWENYTGQTQDSLFWNRAKWDPDQQQMWGVWGVEDRPRIDDDATTVDVALFLEFGTVKMRARPWLYPAFNAVKGQFEAKVAEFYAIVKGEGRVRNALGRYAPNVEIGGLED